MDIELWVKFLYIMATFGIVQGVIILVGCYLDFKEKRNNEDMGYDKGEQSDSVIYENEEIVRQNTKT